MGDNLPWERLAATARRCKVKACHDSPSKGPLVVAVVATFLIAALPNANFILDHFYAQGAYMLDSGFFLGMFSGHDLSLRVPLAISGTGTTTFWPTHIPPTLLLFPLLHHLMPIFPITWFALIMGFVYGLLGCAVAWMVMSLLPRNWFSACFAVVAATAFIFSPPIVSAIMYPHFEFLFVALICFFALAVGARRNFLAFVFLTLALGVREDSGLHFVAIAATYLVLIRIYRPFTRVDRTVLIFAGYALAWSIAAIALQKMLAPGDNALARVYFGHPAFSHLNAAFIKGRIETFLRARTAIDVFWVWLVAWAIVRRSLVPLAGFLAFLPWTLLNVLAISDGPSTLGLYYDFPLVLGFVWPLIHAIWHRDDERLKLALVARILAARPACRPMSA